MQQAGGELLNVQTKARTIFNSSYEFDQHVGSHWQTVIALKNISLPVAFLQVNFQTLLNVDISNSSSEYSSTSASYRVIETERKHFFLLHTCRRGATRGWAVGDTFSCAIHVATNINNKHFTAFDDIFLCEVFAAAPAKRISRHSTARMEINNTLLVCSTYFMLFLYSGCLTSTAFITLNLQFFFAISIYVERSEIRKSFSMVKS